MGGVDTGGVALLNRPANGFQASGLGEGTLGKFASPQFAGHGEPRRTESLILANEPTG